MKSNNEKFYKMKREDGEVFEIKESIVESKKSQGYELVDDEPITRNTNTSKHNAQKQEVQQQQQQQQTEEESEESEEGNEEEPQSIDDLSYNELQSFVSERADDYKVVGKSTEDLAEKARQIMK